MSEQASEWPKVVSEWSPNDNDAFEFDRWRVVKVQAGWYRSEKARADAMGGVSWVDTDSLHSQESELCARIAALESEKATAQRERDEARAKLDAELADPLAPDVRRKMSAIGAATPPAPRGMVEADAALSLLPARSSAEGDVAARIEAALEHWRKHHLGVETTRNERELVADITSILRQTGRLGGAS
jgi:hypothetical protein